MPRIHSAPLKNRDPKSELKVFEALLSLDQDWHVIHSVAWIGLRGGRVGDGEADFLLLHPRIGAIIVEVKGGGIDVAAGRWTSEGNSGVSEIKDPYRQATESKVGLHKWVQENLGIKLPTAHCVAFPDMSSLELMGPHTPSEITITLRDLPRIDEKLREIVAFWKINCNLSATEIEAITKALAPRVSARRLLADDAFEAHQTIINLTQEQIRAFAGMRRNRRAVILGGAGTGKTILAIEKALEFREQGGQVALLCFNNLLASHLAADPRLEGVTVKTFHAFCMEKIREAGLQIPDKLDSVWWETKAAEMLIDAIEITDSFFDGVVVDEGQDFEESWVTALSLAGAAGDATPFYIFADEQQDLWPRSWTPDPTWPVYQLTMNCRNTVQIASRLDPICRSSQSTLGAQGPECRWTNIPSGTPADRIVARVVERLLNEGFEANEVCVLCEDYALARRLREMTVGDQAFMEYGSNGITVETIARFKGLESPAVVVALASQGKSPDVSAYVGFSRATTFLNVVADPLRKKQIPWAD